MASPSLGAKSRAERHRLLYDSGAFLFALILLTGFAAEGAPPQMVGVGIVAVLAALGLLAWHAYAWLHDRRDGKPRHPTAPEFIAFRRLNAAHSGEGP